MKVSSFRLEVNERWSQYHPRERMGSKDNVIDSLTHLLTQAVLTSIAELETVGLPGQGVFVAQVRMRDTRSGNHWRK